MGVVFTSRICMCFSRWREIFKVFYVEVVVSFPTHEFKRTYFFIYHAFS